jgi:hypothetical protein
VDCYDQGLDENARARASEADGRESSQFGVRIELGPGLKPYTDLLNSQRAGNTSLALDNKIPF